MKVSHFHYFGDDYDSQNHRDGDEISNLKMLQWLVFLPAQFAYVLFDDFGTIL
jgi:hypothetical protein